MNCVLIENPKTDEIVDVGMTCAERVGLDMAALRAMLRERFQAEQREANRIEREEREKTRAEKEAADTAAFGEHGTESRWNSGCRCNLCSSQAPHGNVERLTYGKCLCDKCIQAAVDGGQYSINTRTKLVDLETRSVLHARLVNTRFGLSWVVNDKDDNPSWYPYMPARRQTMTKRGAVEVEMQCLVRSYHYDGDMHYKEVAILSSPGVDRWDEPIDVDQSSFGFLVQRKEEDV
jgi:hypothetical protein